MAETTFRIPLTNEPQSFAITLVEKAYQFRCQYNPEIQTWALDIYDGITQEPILLCMPLVTGIDLLRQYRYLGIPGSMIVYTDGDPDAPPTLENLGNESNLYYVVDVPE
jgi:hypothetical protein